MEELDCGQLGLIVLSEGTDPTIDIIAVHGLGANPAWAWVRKVGDEPNTQVNWLRDANMLPQDIPDGRILAFNYESRWHADAPKQRIYLCAEQLLTAIDNTRKEEPNTLNRPIIFIGHSFGGIVIEQALVSANIGGSQFTHISLSTVGIAFFGTPHQGSSSASWGEILARSGKCLGLGSDDAILSDLRESSTVLADLVHNFTLWLFRMSVNVVCFFEQHETDYGKRFGVSWKEMVVDERSGCIHGHRKVALPTDHLKINKYAGRRDPCYNYVYPIIKDMARSSLDKVNRRLHPQQPTRDNSQVPPANFECQKALFLTYPPDDLARIRRRLGKRVEGTCEWLLVQEKYVSWLVGDCPQLLRLVGGPGMGKTMMASYLVEELEKKMQSNPQMMLAYHFCDNKNNKTNTATSIIRGLLIQVFQQRPWLFKHIQRDYDMMGVDLFNEYEAMWRILLTVIEDFGDGELYLLVDALDECDIESRENFLSGLRSLSRSIANVRVLITCRPEEDIEALFHGTKVSLFIRLEDINTDLSRYMDEKVAELVDRKGWKIREERMIKDALLSKANGIFLWASFVLQDIATVKRVREIPEKLRTLPANLRDVYARILNNIGDNDVQVVKTILKIVVGARRPLKISELAMAYLLAFDSPDSWEANTMPTEDDLYEFGDGFKCCGLLIQLDAATDTVNLVHQSAKDYLLDSYLKESCQSLGETTSTIVNTTILEICFRYLSLKDLDYLARRMVFFAEWNIDWDQSWWEVDAPPPFLSYVGKEWESHAIAAESTPLDYLSRLSRTLQGRQSLLNSWLRRAAIMGNMSLAKWLLYTGAEIDSMDFRGWTALQLAAKHGQQEVVSFLVSAGANPNTGPAVLDGRTALQTAAEESHASIVEQLLRAGADINALPADIHGRTALQAAAEKGHRHTVSILLRNGADPNGPAASIQGVTALLAAAGSGGERHMGKNTQRTIKQRSNLSASNTVDATTVADEDRADQDMRDILEANHEAVISELIRAGAEVQPDSYGWTALHAAAERQSINMVTNILKIPNVEVNWKAAHGGTPLFVAIAKSDTNLEYILQGAGAINKLTHMVDLDSMMKYIRAVITRILMHSNTQRFFFIQSYIPVYHIVFDYCYNGKKETVAKPVRGAHLQGELIYSEVNSFIKLYVSKLWTFLEACPVEDFLVVYVREWKLYRHGEHYITRLLRYLGRYWIKREMDEGNKDVYGIPELFCVRWRTGMPRIIHAKVDAAMARIKELERQGLPFDKGLKDAVDESFGGIWEEYVSAIELFGNFLFKDLRIFSYSKLEDNVRSVAAEFEANGVIDKRQALLNIPGLSPGAVDILLRMLSGEQSDYSRLLEPLRTEIKRIENFATETKK